MRSVVGAFTQCWFRLPRNTAFHRLRPTPRRSEGDGLALHSGLPDRTMPTGRRNTGIQIIGTVTLLIKSSGPYGRSCGAMKSNEWLAQIVILAGEVAVSPATQTAAAAPPHAAPICPAHHRQQTPQ